MHVQSIWSQDMFYILFGTGVIYPLNHFTAFYMRRNDQNDKGKHACWAEIWLTIKKHSFFSLSFQIHLYCYSLNTPITVGFNYIPVTILIFIPEWLPGSDQGIKGIV